MQWINRDRPVEISSEIIEWDCKRAGISICKQFNLIPNKQIDKLESLSKDKCDKALGMLSRDDKEFAKKLEDGFNKIVDDFINENHLDRESDIISIKRDAIFVINHNIVKEHWEPNITFRNKNSYVGYIAFENYEFYIKSDGVVDTKGMSTAEFHKDGILHLIYDFYSTIANSNMDIFEINKYLSELANLYKKRQLDPEYYREFNSFGKYRMRGDEKDLVMSDVNGDELDDIDISFNYESIILPLIRLFRQ